MIIYLTSNADFVKNCHVIAKIKFKIIIFKSIQTIIKIYINKKIKIKIKIN